MFELKEEVYRVEYEGLHLLCRTCGKFGHYAEGCPDKKDPTPAQIATEQGHAAGHREGPITRDTMRNVGDGEGPWVVVQKPRRQRKAKEGTGKETMVTEAARNAGNNTGTRFDILGSINDDPETNAPNNEDRPTRDASVHQIPNPAHGKGKGNTGKKTGDKKGKAAADKAINEARNKNTIRTPPQVQHEIHGDPANYMGPHHTPRPPDMDHSVHNTNNINGPNMNSGDVQVQSTNGDEMDFVPETPILDQEDGVPDATIRWQQTQYSYPSISESERESLKDNICNGEVRSALFAMAPWKAPGPDGFPAGFYQSGWSEMESSWSLINGEQSLWGDVLVGKYGREGWRQGRVAATPNDSALWKAIVKVWPNMEFHRCWSIGDGTTINFWTDKWIDEHTRISDLKENIPASAMNWKVKDVVLPSGDWNYNILQNLIPQSIIQKLHAIVPPHDSQGKDVSLWPGTSTGAFTVSAAYHLITGDIMKHADKKWAQVWKIEGMERVKVFTWQLVHDRLLTKSRLARWNITSPLCHNCHQFIENTIHVVRDCKVAVHVWQHLLSSQERGVFFMVDLHDWIDLNINNKVGRKYGTEWKEIWATACFLLWKWRNKTLHDDEFVIPEKPWQVIVEYVNTYKASMAAEELTRYSRDQSEVNISWLPPPPGWIAMNTDGAAKTSERRAGCGGVLRNDNGTWIAGFTKALVQSQTITSQIRRFSFLFFTSSFRMLRDSKLPRRNLGKHEEIENLDPSDSSLSATNQRFSEASRPPLNTIQDIERTPSKTTKRKGGPELRTPDRSLQLKQRFAWPQRNETVSSMFEDRRGSGIGNATPRVNRTAVRACSESNSTQSTPTKSVTKPPPSSMSVRGKTDGSFGVRLGNNYPVLYRGVSSTPCTPTVVNTVEVPHFDLKEDSSFWINHNVQVIIRVRPLNSMERSLHNYNRCLKQESSQCINWIGQLENRFTFDHVACETVDQEMIFRMAGLPMVENCLSGYNSCMFAYGQTGSGKTYTMLGEIEDLDVKPSPHRGMTPRIFEFLFARIQAEEESRRDENLKYNCKCSFLEIYNEQITDLLDPSSTNLLLREDVKKGVYVENLSEFEAQSVSDIIRLLIQGSANRKVAATNMNRESSRSHCVFTCVIESTWEKDSTTNYRFARLNLVDLAGSERQKTSGAEGERLKEAANINKSLSTLGHVIMILVDVANGKQRHIPYRDSRLTFLLQDSLGGNSKTMIIANVSPSICCAAETLNTLKFAQRAKLIQNNAVVNEDSSGDVIALKHQIRLLKEEISILKRCQNVSRSLSFRDLKQSVEDCRLENETDMTEQHDDDILDDQSKGTRMSHKQFESLKTTLAGALRREQIAETSIRQLEAEIELLNCLVRQREEETMSCKMMLRFREDKIRRLESQVAGSITADQFLQEDNKALSDEIQLLQGKIDQNPEVTRFAKENIRLQEQLRRYEEFYGEGEREILLSEVSSLREQLLPFLARNSVQGDSNYGTQPQKTQCCSKQNDTVDLELRNALDKLEECRHNLNCCLEENARLNREIDSFHSTFNNTNATKVKHEPHLLKHTDDILDLHLELDIIKIILKEERTSRGILEERATCLNHEILMEKDKLLLTNKQLEDANNELKVTKSVIEALESQQVLSIKEIEDMQNKNNNYLELVNKQEREIMALKNQLASKDIRDGLSSNHPKIDNECRLQVRFGRMHDSLEKAKQLNMFYQSDRAQQISNEEEMDEVRRQAEAETAEVILCMQEELAQLQHQVNDSHQKEIEMKEHILQMETELKDVQGKLLATVDDNQSLSEELWHRDNELKSMAEEWQLLTSEIEEILADGCQALDVASDELDHIRNSFPQKRIWISEQVGMVVRKISEKELLIDELGRCLEDASNKRSDMECMLNSLRSATLVMTEAHQKEYAEIEKEVLLLTSQLSEKTSSVKWMEEQLILAEDRIQKTSNCATVAFVVVNRLSDVNRGYLVDLKHNDILLSELAENNERKDALLIDQSISLEQAERQIAELQEKYDNLWQKLSEEKEHSIALEQKVEDIENNVISETREQLLTLQDGVSSIRSSMASFADNSKWLENGNLLDVCTSYNDDNGETRGSSETHHQIAEMADLSFKLANSGYDKNNPKPRNICKDARERDDTINLLRKEIECALESLKEVQDEITKLNEEKKEMSICEKQSQESIKCLTTQILALQAAMVHFEEQSKDKIEVHSYKLRNLEKTLKEAVCYWNQTKELLELEVGEAKIVQVQKAEEAYCVLAKFEEAQETMKEADIMINELVIANESMKIDIEKLKEREVTLLCEKDILFNRVESLQTVVDLKDQEIGNLVESNLIETRGLVTKMDDVIQEVQLMMKENFMSLACDIECFKSQFLCSTKLIQPWFEEIWSDIIINDCAMSVLHLCHTGVLLESVTGMHAEIGLLSHGMCESKSVINDLKEHNFGMRQELEMCRVLKEKLLADIHNSFDRITGKEVEAGEITIKLNTFAKNLSELQLQEEMLVQRSNEMGSQLAMLTRELNLSNTDVVISLLDQEKLLKERVEATESQAEFFMANWYAKDIELLILTSECRNMACNISDMEVYFDKYSTLIEQLKKETIFFQVETELAEQILMDKEIEVSLLKREVQKEKVEKGNLLMELKQNILSITEMGEVNKVPEQNIELLKDTESQAELLMADWHAKDFELLIRDSEFRNMACNISGMEEHVVKYSTLIEQLTRESILFQVETELAEHVLMDKEVEVSLLKREVQQEKEEKQNLLLELKQNILRITEMGEVNKVLEQNIELLKDVTCSNSALKGELLEVRMSEKRLLHKIQDLEVDYDKLIGDVIAKDVASEFSSHQIFFLEDQFKELKNTNYMLENSCCELKNELHLRDSEITRIQSLLQLELSRKEDVIKGLLYDLSLLQESASNSKDQKDEMDEMVATIEALESELTVKSGELAAVVANCQLLEAQLMDNSNRVIALESDLSKEREVVKLQVSENHELRDHIEDAVVARKLAEEELKERMRITESLEEEILEMSSVLGQMNDSIKNLSVDRDALSIQRDQLQGQVILLKESFEKAVAQAEANEAIAQEAQEMAEARKVYAEEKEAEVELLERSIEELESTINVLENNVDFIKGEAERQRLQREDLEIELCSLKDQMQNLRNADDDIKRFLDEKEKSLEEAQNHIQILKSDIAGKDAEVAQMKAHIAELNLHAEAQAVEYKQKFKALETMAEQVKPEGISTQSTNALSNKSEKNSTKTRGSGSPFKCIGLGLAQQVKYEKVEELSAARLRIEELESQAACRQKEIFSLNARLAAAESMTHDVIRDLLGVKLDMTTYMLLLDNHQVKKITEKAQFLNLEPQEKEQEITKLKRQLNEFIEERKGWLQDIDRKQAELVAAQIALEKLRQRDQLLKTENELLRMENASNKTKLMELEEEMNKLSGQQNLQQRIHHHAKIKEENNTLKLQNEQLSAKLRRAEIFTSRAQEVVSAIRASTGSKKSIAFDEEQRLRKMLKDLEEEKVRSAQQLLRLSTNVLKAAGITKPAPDVNTSIAEEALEKLKNRISSLEMEQEDLMFKNKIMKEKIRLSELMPRASSPLSSRSEENRITPPRASKAPFLSSFDR
ncbi:phragmoplast orienting kinesin [Trifolium repens]|nr:phragmoplast orienting kinesin [Trifolium repens]